MKRVFHHVGIPTAKPQANEIYLDSIKLHITDSGANEYRIEWVRPEAACPLHPLIKSVPHVAYQVDDLAEAIKDRHVIAEPFEPLPGVRVAFIESDGAPVEFIQVSQ